MPGWWLIALQVAGPPAPVPVRPAPERPCPLAKPGEEIVVCAKSSDSFRLKPMAERFGTDRPPPRAQTSIGGVGVLSADVEQGADAQGGAINRAMIRLRMPLGGKKR